MEQSAKQPYREFLGEVVRIGAPVIVQSVLGSLVNMLDVMMIGQLGEVSITASSVSNQWFILYSLLANALCAAGGMFISQYWGKKDVVRIHRFMGILFYGVVFLGAAFAVTALWMPDTILGLYSKDPLVLAQGSRYLRILGVSFLINSVSIVFITGLRSIGITKIPMLASGVSVVVNGALNYLLIFGKLGMPVLGIEGAAIATVVARLVECGIAAGYVYRKKPAVYAGLKAYLSVPANIWKKYFKLGFWIIFAEVLYAIGNNLYNMAFKYTGTEAQAALQIINTYKGLAMILCGGVGTAAAVMIGMRLGNGNFDGAKQCCKRLLLFCLAVSAVISVLVIACAPLLLGIFRVSDTVSGYLQAMILILALAIPLKLMNYLCIVGILRSGGDSTFCFIANMFGVWCVGLPLVYLSAVRWGWPIPLVYLMVNAEDLGKFLIAFPRVMKYKWMNDLT